MCLSYLLMYKMDMYRQASQQKKHIHYSVLLNGNTVACCEWVCSRFCSCKYILITLSYFGILF